MTDELNNEQQQEQEQDPIDIINDLKANTVSKDEFDKLKAQNTKLMKALANGEKVPTEETEKAADIRKELFANTGAPMSNLEYVKKALRLRKALIAEGKDDPFLPAGHNVSVTQEDINAAERVADVFEQCVEAADGDSEFFTAELQRRTRDVRVRR